MRVALAWGGGIGSVLALDAMRGHDVTLVHALGARGARAVPDVVVEGQAAALGLPLRFARGENELEALSEALARVGAERVAFGYLRGEENAGMFKLARATREAGVEPLLPVRHLPAGEAARAFLASGHRGFVRAVAPPAEASALGRFLDEAVVEDLDGSLGRGGWSGVRTLAVEGPLFSRRVDVMAGEQARTGESSWLELGMRGC